MNPFRYIVLVVCGVLILMFRGYVVVMVFPKDSLRIGDTSNAFLVWMFSLNSILTCCRLFSILLDTLIKTGCAVSLSPPNGGTGLAQCEQNTIGAKAQTQRVIFVMSLFRFKSCV